jgi:carbamoyl-phosphate synthase/aspartate carbamoyltransferase
MDELLGSLSPYFESKEIHVAGMICASYAGEDYSHYLAESSLGTWLKEQGVPAIYGVDTRALTKKIRTQGSMLGKMMLQKSTSVGEKIASGLSSIVGTKGVSQDWRNDFEEVDWVDPNVKNLVAEGNLRASIHLPISC